jgi:hypothetical protein
MAVNTFVTEPISNDVSSSKGAAPPAMTASASSPGSDQAIDHSGQVPVLNQRREMTPDHATRHSLWVWVVIARYWRGRAG